MPLEHDYELEVQALSPDGRAVCRQGDRVVFVEGGLPGQRIRARLIRRKKRFAEGIRTALLAPAADAVSPACREHSLIKHTPVLRRLPLAGNALRTSIILERTHSPRRPCPHRQAIGPARRPYPPLPVALGIP